MKPNNIKNRIKSRLFNLQDIKCGSMSENEKTQITNPLNASVASNTGIRVKLKKFLEKVPLLGPLLLWCWRLITLPSRFHRLSRHFEAEVQGIKAFTNTLTKQDERIHMLKNILKDLQAVQENKNQLINQRIEQIQAGQDNAIQKVNQNLDDINKKITEIKEPVSLTDTFLLDITPYLSPEEKRFDDNEIFYQTFEKVFRGSESDIEKRQRIYLEYVREPCKMAKDGKYFLDAGCGRGEFLRILQEADIPAKGVEIITSEYNLLKSKGFDLEHTDINTFLGSIDDNTLSGIACLHVIEHFTHDYLKTFLDQAYRKIAVNGMIILETVNTKCSVALSNFYLDPTHIKPTPPELLKFLLEWYGFRDIKVLFSSPSPENFRVKDVQEQNYLDVAVIGRKR